MEKSIGELIRIARKSKGMTQKELAIKSGIAEITIRQYEKGKYKPKYDKIKKIAQALDMPYYQLLVDPMPDQKSREGYLTAIKEKLLEIEVAAKNTDEAEQVMSVSEAVSSLINDVMKTVPENLREGIMNQPLNDIDPGTLEGDTETLEKKIESINVLIKQLNFQGIKEIEHYARLIYMIDIYRKGSES
jgi:transcriptional regulator with XRE-family HTH domain